MLETINFDHIMNVEMRRKIKIVSIVPNLLQECVAHIVKRFNLMVALGSKTLPIHIKPTLVTRSKGQRGVMSIMVLLVTLLDYFKSFNDLILFMGQGL